MKKSLHYRIGCMILLLPGFMALKGQTIVLSEDFSGFTTGTHETPTTFDYGESLDTRTQLPGWTGYKVNSAGGEIKLGTADITGWLETPSIDLSADEGKFKVKFDICRWPGDATTVQVILSGTAPGTTITPADSYETIEISGTGGTAASRIKIQGLTKRFYLDNFSVSINSIATGLSDRRESLTEIKIYPIPVQKVLYLSNIQHISRMEICDISGSIVRIIHNNSGNNMQADVEDLSRGIYIIRFISAGGVQVKRFIKL